MITKYTQRWSGGGEPWTDDERERLLLTFKTQAEALGWIEDRKHPERYELMLDIFESSSGMQQYENRNYHVLRKAKSPPGEQEAAEQSEEVG